MTLLGTLMRSYATAARCDRGSTSSVLIPDGAIASPTLIILIIRSSVGKIPARMRNSSSRGRAAKLHPCER